MAQRPRKIPPAVQALFEPFANAFGAMLKKSFIAAADTALQEVQGHVDEVSAGIGRARRTVRKKVAPLTPEAEELEGEVVEAPSRVRRRPRKVR